MRHREDRKGAVLVGDFELLLDDGGAAAATAYVLRLVEHPELLRKRRRSSVGKLWEAVHVERQRLLARSKGASETSPASERSETRRGRQREES